jgi:hypothetical protein
MAAINTTRNVGVALLGLFLLFSLWWYEGNNFTDHNLPGTWVANGSSDSDLLILKQDHTYEQTATMQGHIERGAGTWRLSGNADAHIVFEGNFFNAPAAAIGQDDHYAFGMFTNTLGFLTLEFQSDTTPLRFHKKHLLF